MQTEELIRTLTSDWAVRRLAHPGWRAACWFAISAGYVVVVVVVIGLRPDISLKLGDLKFLVGVGAAFLTSMMAAAAAFWLVVRAVRFGNVSPRSRSWHFGLELSAQDAGMIGSP